MTAPTTERRASVPSLMPGGYELTPSDHRLISEASDVFGADYRYLLDMVTTASKADRLADSWARKETSETLAGGVLG